MVIESNLVSVSGSDEAVEVAGMAGLLPAAAVTRYLGEQVWTVEGELIGFYCPLGGRRGISEFGRLESAAAVAATPVHHDAGDYAGGDAHGHDDDQRNDEAWRLFGFSGAFPGVRFVLIVFTHCFL